MGNPALGQDVIYVLNEHDADSINAARTNSDGCKTGNFARRGEEVPGKVVRTFGENAIVANLQLFLDGNDGFWVTSRPHGREPGQWRVKV